MYIQYDTIQGPAHEQMMEHRGVYKYAALGHTMKTTRSLESYILSARRAGMSRGSEAGSWTPHLFKAQAKLSLASINPALSLGQAGRQADRCMGQGRTARLDPVTNHLRRRRVVLMSAFRFLSTDCSESSPLSSWAGRDRQPRSQGHSRLPVGTFVSGRDQVASVGR